MVPNECPKTVRAVMDDRGGAEHAAAFYEEWDFAKKAVELYAAGVAWKGMTIYGRTGGSESSEPIGEVDEDALREFVPGWMVTGKGELALSMRPEAAGTVEEGSDVPRSVSLLTPWQSGVDRGATLLWPACTNHQVMLEMRDKLTIPMAQQLLQMLLGFAYDGLSLPSWALDPVKARSASSAMVTMGLHFYRLRVDDWRESIQRDVEDHLQDALGRLKPNWDEVFPSWNGEWRPHNSYEGWDALYEAFTTCGLTLHGFASEYVSTLRGAVEDGLFPRSVLTGWERLGL